LIRKHVDLIAVGILLWGAALVSTAHHVQFLPMPPFHREIIIEPPYSPHVVMPELPKVPEPPRVRVAVD
jgi:hypothetical protein